MASHILAIILPLLAFAWYGYGLMRNKKYRTVLEQALYFACICFYFHIRHYVREMDCYPYPYLNALHTLIITPSIPLGHYFLCRLFDVPAPDRATWGMLACGILALPSVVYNIVCPNTDACILDDGINMLNISFSDSLSIEISLSTLTFILQSFWLIIRLNNVRRLFTQQQLHTSKSVQWLLVLMGIVVLLMITGNYVSNRFHGSKVMADLMLTAYSIVISCWMIILSIISKNHVLLDANNNPGRMESDPVRALTIGIRYQMEEKKMFVQQGLKLEDLAHSLGTNRTYLSTAIHKTYNCSFPELLMQLRVAEAKRLLREKPNLLISEVADQSGFSSSSVFGKAFRESTGMTAKEYRSQEKK